MGALRPWSLAHRPRRRGRRRLHGPPPLPRLPRGALDRDRPARPALRPPPAPALRLPRPRPDRPADEPGQHRPPADPGLRRDDPADDLERRHRAGGRRSSCSSSTRCSRCSPSAACRSSTCSPSGSPRRLHPAVMGIQQESAELAAVVEETVAGRPGREGLRRRARPGRAACEARPTTSTSARWRPPGSGPPSCPALELLPNIGLIAILGYGGHQVLDGELTLGAAGRLQRLRRHADLAAADARA